MSSKKQNQDRLKLILKNCKNQQQKIQQLKKILTSQTHITSKKNLFLLKKQNTSELLIKKSRVHMEQFQRRNVKVNSGKQKLISMVKSEHCSPQQKEEKSDQRKSSKFTLIQKQQLSKNKKEENSDSQQQQKLRPERIFPQINSIFCQTYKPKNASLSQHALGQKLLKNSIHRKQYQKKCKQYDKQNMMRQYQRSKELKQQKISYYRLHILKEICHQNVKKALVTKNINKQKKDILELQQKNFSRSCIFQA